MNVSTIYVGETVISRYGLTGNKTQDWWISFKNRVYLVPYTEKLPQNAHTGIKKLGHEFPFGTFRPENRTTFSDIPLQLPPEILLLNDSKNRVLFTF